MLWKRAFHPHRKVGALTAEMMADIFEKNGLIPKLDAAGTIISIIDNDRDILTGFISIDDDPADFLPLHVVRSLDDTFAKPADDSGQLDLLLSGETSMPQSVQQRYVERTAPLPEPTLFDF